MTMLARVWIVVSLLGGISFAAPANTDELHIFTRQNRPAIGAGPATATDGSTIVENQVVINGLNMRFKVSAPNTELVSVSGVRNGTLGINVLFHGDGGTSFFDFPNQGVKQGLMGVALLSPDPGLRWGGSGRNPQRPQGAAHSAAVNQFLTTELPKIVNFDRSQIFMEGISGGALLLSGFMVPTFGASLGVKGVVMGCGGLPPQVQVQGNIANIRIHWQSTVNEFASLKQSISQGITAYSQVASGAGLSAQQINQIQTADASPNGGHCAFDQRGFVSGVQLLTDNFSSIMAGQGQLNGVNVNKGVAGAGNIFTAGVTNGNVAVGGARQQGAAVNANAANRGNAGAQANASARVNAANRTGNRVNTANANRNRVSANRNRVNTAAVNRNRVNAVNRNRVTAGAGRNRVNRVATAGRTSRARPVAGRAQATAPRRVRPTARVGGTGRT